MAHHQCRGKSDNPIFILAACSAQLSMRRVLCRVADPLTAAAEVYERLEAWEAAADLQRDLALACSGAGLTARRNAAAAAWQRLQELAKHGVQA